MVFKLTGWIFADEGKKATSFSNLCKALGVQFDFSRSEQGLLHVCNTEARREELVQQIGLAIQMRCLDKQETLALRGRLRVADSFLHGRLGKLVLKQLVDHAYGTSTSLDKSLVVPLKAVAERLTSARARVVSSQHYR